MTSSTYLLLGSNLGNRLEILSSAIQQLEFQVGKIIKTSSVYESEPWGVTDQQRFLNQIIEIETGLSPENLLETCLNIEKDLGRTRFKKWRERTIDIDILFYNNDIIKTSSLIVPHPQIHNRRFTLVPLCEMDKSKNHPILNKSVEELLKNCEDKLKVWVYTS